MRCRSRILFFPFCIFISSCPNTICWKSVFFHWVSFSPFQNSTGCLYLGLFLNSLHSSLPSVHACQSLCQFHTALTVVVSYSKLKTGWSDASSIIPCFQIILAVQDLLTCHINFRSGSRDFWGRGIFCSYGFSYFYTSISTQVIYLSWWVWQLVAFKELVCFI